MNEKLISVIDLQSNKNKPCIYSICNTLNNRVYVGSTINLYRRFFEHKIKLETNNHISSYLQNDYNKCNCTFIFQIVEYVDDPSDLLFHEQKWLDILYDNQNLCYNILPTAGNHLGAKRTKETKIKISLSNKGKKKSQIHCEKIKKRMMKKAKPVFQFDLQGNLIKEYESIREACRITGIKKVSIMRSLKYKILTGKKYIWCHKEDKNISYEKKDLKQISKNLLDEYFKLKNENSKIKLDNLKKRHIKK